ncbi:MAG: Na+/phosphate symporter [Bacteriovoracaceae bacterium]
MFIEREIEEIRRLKMIKTLSALLLLSRMNVMAKRPTKEQVDNACSQDIANYCAGLEKRELMEYDKKIMIHLVEADINIGKT